MNLKILNTEVQEFILENLQSDISKLILKRSPFSDVSTQEIAQQIIGKQKAKDKLPTWFHAKNVYYPPKLNLEQTSSEVTAKYKADLVSGKKCIDLTGGFGIDTFFFSKQFDQVIHCDINEELSKISKYNASQLGANSIVFHHGDGLAFLASQKQKFDCVYIDPSRRNDKKGKVFLLQDCLPNIPDNLELLFKFSKTLLLKYSPMLDIQKGIDSLGFVKEVHVVAINNEVKELLFLLEKGYDKPIEIKTINFTKTTTQKFQFKKSDTIKVDYSEPLSYLYEPNSAILKSGGFQEIANQYNINKLHQHSHLYTSNNLIDFPGRKFKILEKLEYNKKTIKLLLNLKANVTTRNFPLTVEQIRKKMKLRSGGKIFLFFTTDMNKNLIVLKSEKANSY